MSYLTVSRQLQELGLNTFTNVDLQKIMGLSAQVVNNFLTYHVKRNNIFRVKRGFYSLRKDESVFDLAKTYQQCYVGTYSALEYYQTTTQRFTALHLISCTKVRAVTKGLFGCVVKKIRTDRFFGYVRANDFFVSDIEKTLIDCIAYDVSSEEIQLFFRFFREKFDKEKLASYQLRMNMKKVDIYIIRLFNDN